ncbi:MAG: toxin-antitoxin system YwqK family antitoxin [Bacteroidota bacterium]
MSFFQGITKVRQAASTKLNYSIALLAIFLLSGQQTEKSNYPWIIEDHNVESGLLTLNSQEGKWYYDGTPFNGYALSWHGNGQLAEKVGYLNGKRHGPASKWYKDGLLSSEKHYVENRLEGIAKTWWPNGSQSTASNYLNRQRHGKQVKWYPNGQIARIMHFNYGKEEGLQQAWLQNGKLYANYEAKNGRFFGLRRSNLCYQLQNEVVQQ